MTADYAALTGLVALLGYYITAWVRVGVDPGKGAVVPVYHPPAGISPAAARYLFRMKYDAKCLAAAVVNLGVHGWLTMTVNRSVYTVQRGESKDNRDLSGHETKLVRDLFAYHKKLRFKPVNRHSVSSIRKRHEKALNFDYEKTHFLTNRKHWFPGILILVFTVLGMAGAGDHPTEILFMSAWLSGWSLGILVLGLAAISAWKRVVTGNNPIASLLPALVITAFAVPFYIGEGLAAWEFARITSPLAMGILIAMAFVLLVFFHLLKAPTLLGRKLMDELAGFRMYLSEFKDNRLAYLHAPTPTRELFEAYLPFAVAFDVEMEWAASFDDVPIPPPHHTGSPWFQWRTDQPRTAAAMARLLGEGLASAITASSTFRRAPSRHDQPHPRSGDGR